MEYTYNSEMGYAFLMRNYRSDTGKWQTSDPLGYPDGWNNYAYCNNGVTSTIDYLGYIIYDLVDKEAVRGYGHSAQIVTIRNSDGTWNGYTYDYGDGNSSSSSHSITKTVSPKLANETAARLAALKKLDPKGTIYDNMTGWNADNEKSQAAKNAMDSYVQEDYDADEHNCRQALDAGLEAAGYTKGIDFGGSFVPNTARIQDEATARFWNLTDWLKSMQKNVIHGE